MELAKEKEEEERDQCDCSAGGGKEMGAAIRVLVVDDSPLDRKIVEMLLKRSGELFEVVSVDSGKKALEVLGLGKGFDESPNDINQNIDLILTDYCMPEMTGYDLLKAVKEDCSLKSIPVVIMSSENNPQRISSCRDDGAEDFILKPLQIKDMLKLRDYVKPVTRLVKSGSKRKMSVELVAENSNNSEACSCEQRPRLAKVAVA